MVLAHSRTENSKVCECTEHQKLLQMPTIELNLGQIGLQEAQILNQGFSAFLILQPFNTAPMLK